MDLKQKVLIVDDNENNIQVIGTMLRQTNYSISVAKDYKKAWENVTNFIPDLILLDINMPEVDGFEICRRLKADPKKKDIPIIFLTAFNETKYKIKGFELGGVDYITKPFIKEEVLARVNTHLKMKKAHEQLLVQEKVLSLSKLISSISHEINNPLSAIKSSALLLNEIYPQSFKQLPNFFKTIGDDKLELTNQLFDTSRKLKIHPIKERRTLKNRIKELMHENGIEGAEKLTDSMARCFDLNEVTVYLPLIKYVSEHNLVEIMNNLLNVNRMLSNMPNIIENMNKIVYALRMYAKTYDHNMHNRELTLSNVTDSVKFVLKLFEQRFQNVINIDANLKKVSDTMLIEEEINLVWTNLLHNAFAAVESKGEITIDINEDSNNIYVCITDNGEGIPLDIHNKIFEPFLATTKDSGEGSGMGLDICKRIVEKHKGNIDFQSVPGKTSFTVTIPITEKV